MIPLADLADARTIVETFRRNAQIGRVQNLYQSDYAPAAVTAGELIRAAKLLEDHILTVTIKNPMDDPESLQVDLMDIHQGIFNASRVLPEAEKVLLMQANKLLADVVADNVAKNEQIKKLQEDLAAEKDKTLKVNNVVTEKKD